MKHVIAAILFIASLQAPIAVARAFTIDEAIKEAFSVPFLKFQGPGTYDNYLTMNLPFEPAADLFKQVLVQERTQLTSRGEAHITVITPVEFWNVLKPQGVTMKEINQIAEDLNIQSSRFDLICIGSGKAIIDSRSEQTFYVVVASEDLINIRRNIQKLFLSKGGNEKSFEPSNFHPHITLGYTKRDLHESDGVIKDSNSCIGKFDR